MRLFGQQSPLLNIPTGFGLLPFLIGFQKRGFRYHDLHQVVRHSTLPIVDPTIWSLNMLNPVSMISYSHTIYVWCIYLHVLIF